MVHLGADHWIPGGGGLFFCLKFVQQIVQTKFVLTTHENKYKKFSKPMECFMPEGRKISCSDPQGKTIYCLVSEMKKN